MNLSMIQRRAVESRIASLDVCQRATVKGAGGREAPDGATPGPGGSIVRLGRCVVSRRRSSAGPATIGL